MVFRIWVELLCLDLFLVGINQDNLVMLVQSQIVSNNS